MPCSKKIFSTSQKSFLIQYFQFFRNIHIFNVTVYNSDMGILMEKSVGVC